MSEFSLPKRELKGRDKELEEKTSKLIKKQMDIVYAQIIAARDKEWMEWANNLLRLLIKHEEAFPSCSCYRRAFRVVQERKRSVGL